MGIEHKCQIEKRWIYGKIKSFPGRLMVGRRNLAPLIGVRVPARENPKWEDIYAKDFYRHRHDYWLNFRRLRANAFWGRSFFSQFYNYQRSRWFSRNLFWL